MRFFLFIIVYYSYCCHFSIFIAMCVYNVILSFALVHNMLQVAASRVG